VSVLWVASEMVCFGCGYDEGIHVWMIGSEPVECPECGFSLCVPKDVEEVWVQ
jgi:hypothetical protein